MVRILQFDAQANAHVTSDINFMRPPEQYETCWIDLEAPDGDTLKFLAQRFNFHPLTIEDCVHFDQMPKIEDYGEYLFLVTHTFRVHDQQESLEAVELHTFLGENFLVTVHDRPLPSLDLVWRRVETDQHAVKRGPDFIRYLIADAMVNELYPTINKLGDDTDAIEANLFGSLPPKEVLHEIMRIKRLNVMLRKNLIPQKNIIATISNVEEKFISTKTAFYFRDIYDNLLRVTETLESNREIVGNVLTGYQWAISQRTNEIVKRLTLLSAVFLPLTFITGFFGQNFQHLPFESIALMVVMLVLCVLVPALMLWYFLRSKWL